MPPEISVIIPAFNEEDNISTVVQSVLDTGFRSFEIIVVDDGSTDRTVAVVKEKFGKDSRVRVLEAGRKGRAGALNLGIGKAAGEFVIITDADCKVEKNWLEEAVKTLKGPEIGAVTGPHMFHEYKSIGQMMHLLLILLLHNFIPVVLQKLGFCIKVTGANMGFRKEYIKGEGFNETTQTDTLDISFKIAKTGHKVFFNSEMMVNVKEPRSTLSYFIKYKRWFGEVGRHFVLHKDVFSSKNVSKKPFYLLVWIVFLILPLLFLASLVGGIGWYLAFGGTVVLRLLAGIIATGFVLLLAASILSIFYYKKFRALLYLPLWLILAPTIITILVYSFFRALSVKEYSGAYEPHR